MSIRQGAFIREELLIQFNSVEGAFIRKELFIWKWAFVSKRKVNLLEK